MNAFNPRIAKKRRDEATKTLQTVRRLLFSGESIDDDQQLAVFDTFVVYKAAKDAFSRVDIDIATNERAIVAKQQSDAEDWEVSDGEVEQLDPQDQHIQGHAMSVNDREVVDNIAARARAVEQKI